MAYYGKDLRVNLAFSADISAAAANIQKLGKMLEDVASNTTIGIKKGPIQEATEAARQLQTHLQNALNVKTGQLNLNKLNESLKTAGTDITTLATKLQYAGTSGQQAFVSLANAIASAETPMLKVNKRLTDFSKTLKNTIKWQAASSAVNMVSSSLTAAVSHAESLNTALNEIRIVTGYNADSMARFTSSAREAANALSSTTTEYARAALIFYQQGLSGKEVLERTNATIKLSNVTGQAVTESSEQLTAIWNNFYDGSKSLEYYADAMAKLGAATASSTDEIATGLQKFAAIADTVGLSYEYATAALATMTSETREASDIVGNALKTIFARMESLKLGDTLDDGVTLGKYSNALKTVGVEILDYKGNLKDMDVILDDLSEKWQSIGKNQQIALAQTVGGVQQYARFISLMETWDKTKENVELARSAEGTLDEQQAIWSEGWEAASKRAKQSVQTLYENLINDKQITVLVDGFSELVGSIDTAIDSMGGLFGIFLKFGMYFSKDLYPFVQNFFVNLAGNVRQLMGISDKESNEIQVTMSKMLEEAAANSNISEGIREQIRLSNDLLTAKQKLAQQSKYMTIAEREEAQRRMEAYEAAILQAQASYALQTQYENELAIIRLKLNSEQNRQIFAQKQGAYNFRSSQGERENPLTIDQVNKAVKMAMQPESAKAIAEGRATAEQKKEEAKDAHQKEYDDKIARISKRKEIDETTAREKQTQQLKQARDKQDEISQDLIDMEARHSEQKAKAEKQYKDSLDKKRRDADKAVADATQAVELSQEKQNIVFQTKKNDAIASILQKLAKVEKKQGDLDFQREALNLEESAKLLDAQEREEEKADRLILRGSRQQRIAARSQSQIETRRWAAIQAAEEKKAESIAEARKKAEEKKALGEAGYIEATSPMVTNAQYMAQKKYGDQRYQIRDNRRQEAIRKVEQELNIAKKVGSQELINKFEPLLQRLQEQKRDADDLYVIALDKLLDSIQANQDKKAKKFLEMIESAQKELDDLEAKELTPVKLSPTQEVGYDIAKQNAEDSYLEGVETEWEGEQRKQNAKKVKLSAATTASLETRRAKNEADRAANAAEKEQLEQQLVEAILNYQLPEDQSWNMDQDQVKKIAALLVAEARQQAAHAMPDDLDYTNEENEYKRRYDKKFRALVRADEDVQTLEQELEKDPLTAKARNQYEEELKQALEKKNKDDQKSDSEFEATKMIYDAAEECAKAIESAGETIQDVSKVVVGKAKTEIRGDEASQNVGLRNALMTNFQHIVEGEIDEDAETSLSVETTLQNYEKTNEVLATQRGLLLQIQTLQKDIAIINQPFEDQNNLMQAKERVAQFQKEESDAETALLSTDVADAEKRAAAEAKYAEAQKKTAAAQQEYAKAQDKASKSATKYKKIQENSEEILGEIKDRLKELLILSGTGEGEALDKMLDSITFDSGSGFSESIQNLEKMESSIWSVSNALDVLINQMEKDLKDTEGFEESKKAVQNLQEQIINSMNQNALAQGLKDPTSYISEDKLKQEVIFDVSEAVSSVMFLNDSLQNLWTSFEDGTNAVEIFSTLLSSLPTILPAVSGAMSALTKVQAANNLITTLGTDVQLAKVAVDNTETTSLGALIVAKYAKIAADNLEASSLGRLIGLRITANAVLSAATIALGLLAAGISIAVQKIKEKAEAEREAREAQIQSITSTQDLIQSWQEECTAMDELIAKYKELNKESGEYYNVTQDIIEGSQDIAKVFREISDSLELSTDNQAQLDDYLYKLEHAEDPAKVESLIDEINTLIANAGSKQSFEALQTVAEEMYDILDLQDQINTQGQAIVKFGKFGNFTNEEREQQEKIAANAFVASTKDAGGGISSASMTQGYMFMDVDDSEQFIEQYQSLMQAIIDVRAALKDAGYDPQNSQVYKDLTAFRDSVSEQYQSALEILDVQGPYKQIKAISDLADKGYHLSEINDVSSYLKYKNKYLNNFKFQKSKNEAEETLDSMPAVEKYAKAAHKIELAKREILEAGGSEKKATAFEKRLMEYHKTLNDEQQELFLQIDFDTFQSNAAIQAEMERLQAIADRETIDVTIGLIDDALDALGDKEGGSKEDYQEIQSSGLFDRAGSIDFNSFLNFDISEQVSYLERARQILSDMSIAESQLELNVLLERQAELVNSKSEAAQKELSVINERIQLLETEALINSQIRDQSESSSMDLDHSEVEEYANHLMEVAESSDLLDDSLKDNEEAAEDVARATMRMNRGVESLYDNFKDWKSMLKKSDKASQEYADALAGVADALADIANVDAKWISDDFVADNLDLIEKAAQGSEEAIDSLRDKLADDILVQIALAHDVDSQLLNEISGLHENLQAHVEDLRVGAQLDDAQFLAAAQQIIDSANMTAQQANEYFRSIGLEPTFEAVPQTMTTSVPEYEMVTELTKSSKKINLFGTTWDIPIPTLTTKTRSTGMSEQSGTVEVPAMSTDGTTPKIKSLTKTSSGSMNNRSSSNKGTSSSGSGSGGSSNGTADAVEKTDVVERYKEINDAIDDLADALDDAADASDRLYGNSKIQQMQKQKEIIQDEIDLLKKKKEEAEDYLEEDKEAIEEAAAEAGVTIKFNSNGTIANYTDVLTSLWEDLDSTITAANKDGNATDSEQDTIDDLQEKIDNLKDAMSQYDETRELIEDLENEIQDKIYAEQDLNAEILSYKLEIDLELNESDLRDVELGLSRLEDNFFKMGEAIALMQSGQLPAYLEQLSLYSDYLDDLNESFEKEDISRADYVEGLREVEDGITSSLEELLAYDDAMMSYYGDTLSAAIEEIAYYTDHMDHCNEVLEHYQSILEAIGESTNYGAIGTVLEGLADTSEDAARAAKASMDMFKTEASERYAEYTAALAAGNDEAAELYLEQYRAALESADEAESEFLSKAQEWADALKAVLENSLAGYAQTLENALTGETSFDQMNSELERAASLQEEYLTTTNKIYETNKLIRTAQKAIDETTNTVAKRKLNTFISETEELQNQAELSNFELSIQQAKYDLLLATIALEEAQNAKSMVRLQRDSEGNFGYVYTADSAKIAEAEQQLEDSQNRLYNIALEGANNYTQKYQQTMSEMYDTLTTLQEDYLNGAFESEEEYNNAVSAAKEYYYDLLKQYSSLYTVAITTDGDVVADAWSSNFSSMISSTETWMVAVDEYIENTSKAFTDWKLGIEEIVEVTGLDLETLATKVGNITTETENLLTELTKEDGVIDSTQEVIDKVVEQTGAYAALRTELQNTITTYKNLAKAAAEAAEAQANAIIEDSTQDTTTTTNTTTKTNTTTTTKKNNSSGGNNNSSKSSSNNSGSKTTTTTTVTVKAYSGLNRKYSVGDIILTKGKNTVLDKVYDSDDFADAFMKLSGFSQTLFVDARDGWKLKAQGFDTGGYTGSWGSEGRLAFLHEKELVLNKDETKDFVAGMNVLRSIVEVLDLQAMSAQIGGILAAPQFNAPSNVLEQQVHIEANFPNATDKTQIEDAFRSLVNLASQYGNRK